MSGILSLVMRCKISITIDEDTLDREYLTAMEWDLKTAKPSKKKLKELGLEDVAKELWP